MVSEKKGSILYILDILKVYSDEQHLLTYEMIGDKLYHSYDLEIERKTIARDISILQEFGFDIVKKGNRGLYLGARDFEEGELMFLIDAIYSSKSMPSKYAKDLAERLAKGFSKFKRKRFNHLEKFDDGSNTDNREIFYNIEILNEAIENRKKVEFQYGAYGIDKKLTLRGDGKVYKISPYFMVNSRGKYYLVCNYDKYDDLSNYKIECISNVRVLEEDIKPIESVCDSARFSIKDYIKEHVYMMAGKTINARVKIDTQEKVNDFIDWFGKDVQFFKSGDKIEALLKVNEDALVYWALQYGEHVEILEPESAREKIKKTLAKMLDKYK
jgi:predicted DNA-binding transcriptional regulator YafY